MSRPQVDAPCLVESIDLMFQATSRLPHVLPPRAYHAPEIAERERITLLREGWHLVGTSDELARPGMFCTVELLGVPLIVRNCDGVLRAFVNACAHRHCRIASAPRGESPRLRCPYHGWEYDAAGVATKIPAPRNFVPLEQGEFRLREHRVATCGQLVFVSLADDGITLEEQLGPLVSIVAERFGPDWSPFLRFEPEYAANWKVPVENSLEAYHIPAVHPHTFRDDPGEQRSRHVIDEQYTSFTVNLPFSQHSQLDAWFQRTEGWLLGRLGVAPHGEYSQQHAFPNLLFSFTDAVSLCHVVLPTSPTTSRGLVLQFSRNARQGAAWQRLVAGAWGRLAAQITKRILREDLRLYGEIQRGLEASPHDGVLGRCEERLFAFQAYLDRRLNLSHVETESSLDCDRAVEATHD